MRHVDLSTIVLCCVGCKYIGFTIENSTSVAGVVLSEGHPSKDVVPSFLSAIEPCKPPVTPTYSLHSPHIPK